jgi:hypothetical protein
MTGPSLKLIPIPLHTMMFGSLHEYLSMMHATVLAFITPLFLPSAMELQYMRRMIFSTKELAHSGRPRVTTPRQDMYLRRQHMHNRFTRATTDN